MNRDADLIRGILDCIQAIREFTAEGQGILFKDRRTRDAVLRNFEVMGEAAKRVSPRIRETYSRIPWADMAGMRDKLIHDYAGVDLVIVWNAIARVLPGLRSELDVVLADLGADDA